MTTVLSPVAKKKPAKNPTLVKFGERLRAARTEAGMTQQQLADATGLHRVTVGKLEAGEYDSTITTVQSLAVALGVPMSRLTGNGDTDG